MAKSKITAKVLRAFYFKDAVEKDKDGNLISNKVGEVVELTEEQFADLEKQGFVKREVVDQSKEVERLTAENAALTKKVAELTAIIEKAANAEGAEDKTPKAPPKGKK